MEERLRPKQFSSSKPCYYCGAAPPSSREHAPVKAMFEAFACDSITVPACSQHNTARNVDDRAIVAFLLRGLEFGFRNGGLTQNQIEAYEMAARKLDHAKEVSTRSMLWDPSGALDDVLPHIDQTARIDTWMLQLTAAIVWSAVGAYDPSCRWDDAESWSPNYLKEPVSASLLETGDRLMELASIKQQIHSEGIHWWPGWSSYPRPYPGDIYRFEVSFQPSEYLKPHGKENLMVVRHWFYGRGTWYVAFAASEGTKLAVRRSVETVATSAG